MLAPCHHFGLTVRSLYLVHLKEMSTIIVETPGVGHAVGVVAQTDGNMSGICGS